MGRVTPALSLLLLSQFRLGRTKETTDKRKVNGMRRYSNDPYWLNARFESQCKCGCKVKRGDRIFYYPNGKTALCAKCGEAAAAEFQGAAMDEAMMTGQSW
jgi:hypothetical protein